MAKVLQDSITCMSTIGQVSLWALVCYFIDCVYIEMTKYQEEDVSNLIQNMGSLGMKWMGTTKNTLPHFHLRFLMQMTVERNKR